MQKKSCQYPYQRICEMDKDEKEEYGYLAILDIVVSIVIQVATK